MNDIRPLKPRMKRVNSTGSHSVYSSVKLADQNGYVSQKKTMPN